MRAYTFDMLLSELGQELPLGNGERYRAPVNRYVKHVFRKIGLSKTAKEFVEPFDIEANEIDPLPEYVLDVLDVGLSEDRMKGMRFGQEAMSHHELSFRETPFGLSFPNKESGTVYLKFLMLQVDENKRLVISEDVYQTCFDYAYAKLLTNFPQHPRYSLQLTLLLKAESQIDETRAFLNKKGKNAHNRMIRKYN